MTTENFRPCRFRTQTGDFIPMTTSFLATLGDKHQPSKMHHDYLKHYAKHLEGRRHEIQRVLEIGVHTGASLRLWEEYFPNATIIGLDIDPAAAQHAGGRRIVVLGDQGNEAFLRELGREHGPFDVVIDDGSHIAHHQIGSFHALADSMAEQGVYVVEDIGGAVGQGGEVAFHFAKLIDAVNHWPDGAHPMFWDHVGSLEDAPDLVRRIVGVHFNRWIVFVEFGRNPEDNPYLHKPSELSDEEILRRFQKYAPGTGGDEGVKLIRSNPYFSKRQPSAAEG